jgi:hypothetical protein
MTVIDNAPPDLQLAIREFWPQAEWNNAAGIAELESRFDPFAEIDTTKGGLVPCGTILGSRLGAQIGAEHSVGYFQINVCNFPSWPWCRLFNTRHNAGTAHMLWAQSGWRPWFFSATWLGLL